MEEKLWRVLITFMLLDEQSYGFPHQLRGFGSPIFGEVTIGTLENHMGLKKNRVYLICLCKIPNLVTSTIALEIYALYDYM